MEVGILGVCVDAGPLGTHGFAIAKTLADRGDTRSLTATGTLYRALHRLEEAGLVESRWEDPDSAADEGRPRRRIYRITGAGAAALAARTCRDAPDSHSAAGTAGAGDMSSPATLVHRAIRAWTSCYTSGLPDSAGAERRAEIDSDLADHQRARLGQGWSVRRTAREQLWRTVRGVPADVAWRRELLAPSYRSNAAVRVVVLAITSVAALAVAAFHAAFAAYLLGADTLAERAWLGGLDNYAEEVGSAGGALVAVVVLVLGAALVAGCVLRPVAPLVANVATVAIAIWSVLWFWLGAAPIGAIAVVGAIADMTLRAPTLRTSP